MAPRTTIHVLVTGLATVVWLADPGTHAASGRQAAAHEAAGVTADLFASAETCVSCHTGMVSADGEDISFGPQWRASMMANSARDPYWHAAVRREITDHPTARALIEDECSVCHMPMARYQSKLAGHEGEVFAHLPVGVATGPADLLAADGVSCTVCHQIGTDRLGTRASFTGGFHVDDTTPAGQRRIFGPFDVDAGRTRIMQSATGFVPTRAAHPGESEMCATCHTLITQSLGPGGVVTGELPEQVPYLEWQHSAYRETQSCQSCHMPVVTEPMPITPVWGPPRAEVSRHAFRGGNSFMTRLFTRFGSELGVEALPQELDAATARTTHHLETETARLIITRAEVDAGRLIADLAVENLAGHKLPTAYPSRRAWLHVTVRDRQGATIFESGRVSPSGAIAGNDNDENGARFEPHFAEIDRPDQVQIYETLMGDPQGGVTTGLLTAVRYLKDNRLLPRGFDKATAPGDVAVHGAAAADADFTAGGDRVRYVVTIPRDAGPYRIEAELYYQSIGYRWAENLRSYEAPEPQRFVRYYEALSAAATVRLASAAVVVR